MKKILPRIILILLAVLLVTALVACNTDEGGGSSNGGNGGGNGGNDYEGATYTVSFVTSNSVTIPSQTVKYGEKVTKPSDPVRAGYVFNCWSTGSTSANAFDFTSAVSSNLTLTAVWTPRVYEHSFDLTATLSQDADGKWVVTSGTYQSGDNEQSLTLNTTYLATASLSSPKTEVSGDYFCFWYYINDDGDPVQFSEWAKQPKDGEYPDSVALLNSGTFRLTKSLKLYPMWYSTLADVTIKYVDENGQEYGKQDGVEYSYKYGDTMLESQSFVPTRAGYKFDGWYYVVKNASDEDVKVNFVFDDVSVDDDNPTKLTFSVSGAENVFTDGVVTLHPRWTKQVTISNESEFAAYHAKVTAEDIDEDELAQLLAADIKITSSFALTRTYSTMFSAERPFTGTIDGGNYNGDTLNSNNTISNGTFEGNLYVAMFGVMNGTIKNLDVMNPTLKILDDYSNKVYIAPLVAVNGGSIINCNSTIYGVQLKKDGYNVSNNISVNGYGAVVFGGICARNTGSIADSYANVATFSFYGESISFGGICGESSSSASVSGCRVLIANGVVIECYSDNNVSNGASYANVGGIVGDNSGNMSKSSFDVTGLTVTSYEVLNLGGAIGANAGTVATTSGKFAAVVNAGGSTPNAVAVGGLIGKNEGSLSTSYVDVNLAIEAMRADSRISAGGIAGASINLAASSYRGSIASSYSSGSVSISVNDDLSGVIVNAGGISGFADKTTFSIGFSVADITVVNANGTNNIGYVVGLTQNSASVAATVWYAAENTLTLNGVAYDEENEPFEINKAGTKTEEKNFSNSEWLTSSSLGFSADVWDMSSGTLPTLKA